MCSSHLTTGQTGQSNRSTQPDQLAGHAGGGPGDNRPAETDQGGLGKYFNE